MKKIVWSIGLLFLLTTFSVQANSTQGIKQVYNNPTTWTSSQQRIRFTLQNSNYKSVSIYDPEGVKVKSSVLFGSFQFTAKQNGTYQIVIELKDGQKIQDEIKVSYIDQEKPNVSIIANQMPISDATLDAVMQHFYKQQVQLNFEVSDALSGVQEVEYQLTDVGEKPVADGWIQGSQVQLSGTQKTQVHVRAQDQVRNQTTINTYGIVIYEDSVVNEGVAIFDIDETSSDFQDVVIPITLNGNQVTAIMQDQFELRKGIDYEVSESQIIFKKEYLQHAIREYRSFEVIIAPLAEPYQPIPSNDAPKHPMITIYEKQKVEIPRITHNLVNDRYVGVHEPLEELEVRAEVTKGELSYQWYRNGIALEGETLPTYTPQANAIGASQYYVEVYNHDYDIAEQPAVARSNSVWVYVNEISMDTNVDANFTLAFMDDESYILQALFDEAQLDRYLKGVDLSIHLTAKYHPLQSDQTLDLQQVMKNAKIQSYFTLVFDVVAKFPDGTIEHFQIQELQAPLQFQVQLKKNVTNLMYQSKMYMEHGADWVQVPLAQNALYTMDVTISEFVPMVVVSQMSPNTANTIVLCIVGGSLIAVIYAALKHRKK